MRDLFHGVLVSQHLNPAVSTSTRSSTTIDLQGFHAAMVIFNIGQSGDTLSGSIFWTLKIQDSDDDVTYSDVEISGLNSNSATIVINSSSLDRNVYSFGYQGNKRYLKAIATPTGTHSSGTPLSVTVLRSEASYSPVI